MKTVQVMSPDGYRTILENYQICFSTFFPQVKIQSKDKTCTINGYEIAYPDIADVTLEDKMYCIINMRNDVHIYLPLDKAALYRIEGLKSI